VSAAVAELSADTELATARALVERRLATTAGLPPQARIRKLVGVLARKGYSPAMAFRVVREAIEEAREDPLLELLGAEDVAERIEEDTEFDPAAG
jgi:regulatory protein